MPRRLLGPLCLVATAVTAGVAGAEEHPGSLPAVSAAGPDRGKGSRRVKAAPAPAPKAQAAAPAEKAPPVRRGKPPARPSAGLPPGTPRPEPDQATRRLIAGGATADDLRAGKRDPELEKLREAERVLFPRPLPGMRPGWSWDLPGPGASAGSAPSSGLPPDSARAGLGAAPSSKDTEWIGSLALPNLPVRYDERVLKYLRFYRDSPSGRAVARAWAKKSGKYRAALESELAKAGLPTDLVWLSLIESGHNPTIASPAGAVGLWQFIPETARTYGLTVDRWVDERMDPERATVAAIRFLSDLYRRFGSWDLAMAAYNMGNGGLSRSIKKFNSNDFWELSRHEAGVPYETALYVPKILATALLMRNKKAFGIDDIEPDPPESFDLVEVGPAVPLESVARSAGLEPGLVERLNPQYLLGRTPPSAAARPSSSHPVRVPKGSAGVAKRLVELERSRGDVASVVVKQGDTPASIAKATRTSEAAIRSLNRIGAQEVLSQGSVLLLPPATSGEPARGEAPEVVVVARDAAPPPGHATRVFYPVSHGDTLDRVARAFGVTLADLSAWNALDPGARLQEGMVLQVFPKASQDLSGLHALRDSEVEVLVAGTPEFFDHFEGLNGKRRLFVKVKQGDTLASIGRRYATSVGWMERINQRSRSDKLVAGETVVVYADRKRYPAPPRPAEPPVRSGGEAVASGEAMAPARESSREAP